MSAEQPKGNINIFGHRGRGSDRLKKHGKTVKGDFKDATLGTLSLGLRGLRNTAVTLGVTEGATFGAYEIFTREGINPWWTLAPEGAALLLTGTVAAWSVIRVLGHAEAAGARLTAHAAETTAQVVEAGIDEALHHGGRAIQEGSRRIKERRKNKGK